MRLPLGSRLGDHEVTALLGVGGMGEVYCARDLKLHRTVALKVLPDRFTEDANRLTRFQREAEILASLNHPNIGAIYGLVEENGVRALVLEFIEGPTLAERIAAGPVPLRQALDIAAQIADALEAAHDRGVIHRDLKPANIKLRPDDTVKLLDFGIAKTLADGQEPAHPSTAVTHFPGASQPGAISGTVGYMSPEQAQGQLVDRRSDVWAFGCVLFEMLTGRPAFAAATLSDSVVQILNAEPDWAALPDATPPAIRRLLERCLAKERKGRLGHMEVARWELVDALAAPNVQGRADVDSERPRSAIGLILVVLAFVVSAFVLITADWGTTPARVTRSSITIAQMVYISSATADLAVTPDGSRIIYGAGTDGLYVRSLDKLEPDLLHQSVSVPLHPFVSPDGQWVGYFDTGRGGLFKVPIGGGTPVKLCEYQGLPRGASWGRDGIIFATDASSGLLRVREQGGEPERLTTAPSGFSHWWPEALPGGNQILFTLMPSVASEKPMIAVISLNTREQKTLFPGTSPRFATTGHLLFNVSTSVQAVEFDPDGLKTTSDPVVVVDNVVTKSLGAADFAVSNNGMIAYVPAAAGDSSQRTLMWVDLAGQEEPLAEPRPFFQLALSRDGTHVAALVLEPLNHDIWEYDLGVRPIQSRRVTFDRASDISPLWSLDGRRIVFASTRDGGHYNLFWRSADGTGEDERLTESPNTQNPIAWSKDGKTLVFWELSTKTGYDIYQMSPGGDRTPRVLLKTPANETLATISPDGRWLAYQSDESGVFEVYVRPYPNLESGRWQVSVAGGVEPVWRGDGRELFYRTNQSIKAVKIETTPVFQASTPEVMRQGMFFFGGPGRKYAVSPDGNRFLVMKPGGTLPTQVVIVQNWLEDPRARLAFN